MLDADPRHYWVDVENVCKDPYRMVARLRRQNWSPEQSLCDHQVFKAHGDKRTR